MEKIWLKSYAPSVPAEINPDAYQSIVELFEESCQKYHDLPAFTNMGVSISYSQLQELAHQFASFLQNDLKLNPGSRIGIMLPNILQYPVVLYGAMLAGLIVVNINPLYTADELIHQVNDSGAEVIVGLSNFASTIEKALPSMMKLKYIIITDVGDLFPRLKAKLIDFALKHIHKKIPPYHIAKAIYFRDALKSGKKQSFKPVAITNTDLAFLQYTGGTTGVSKGAMLTHRNIIANIMQADAWFKTRLSERKEIIITALPLYHIFSLTANCIYFMKIGGSNILITNPRDTPRMVKEMSHYQFTAMTGVNTLFNALIKDPNFARLDFSQLRLALGGGMAVQRVVAEKWQEITKAPLLEAYGLTETSPCVTINPTTLKAYNGSIGLPVPSTDVCFFDDERNEVPIGEPGELAIKGPQVTQGYWQNPQETARVFIKDGWLLTGDVGLIDNNGFIRLLERKKDMILVSGFNVYPNEVEGVIAKMPGVREVAVVGVVDANSGEAVKAFVVKDNPNLTAPEIIKFAHEHLTSYKVPKLIEFRSDLPKTNVGKILRRALRNAS